MYIERQEALNLIKRLRNDVVNTPNDENEVQKGELYENIDQE
jgi:hypothetical protein